MSSTIKVNNISNLAGDNSGIDLSTNDQIILKTNNTTAVTVNSSQAVALAGNASIAGTATVGGTLGVTGITTLGNNLIIPNGGNIGSASDTDAMAIASNGVVTFSQPPVGVGGITQTSTVTASGTEVDFLNIPSTAIRITLILKGASLSADGQNAIIQLGTSSGLKSSGYLSNSHYGSAGVGRTDGFAVFFGGGAANVVSGAVVIYHLGSNKYSSNHSAKYNQNNGLFGGGDVTLGGTLDRLRLRPDGNTSFDAGDIKLFIE
jgi:hypothetical protein